MVHYKVQYNTGPLGQETNNKTVTHVGQYPWMMLSISGVGKTSSALSGNWPAND